LRGVPERSARIRRTQFIIAAFASAALTVASVTGFVWGSKTITVIVDGKVSQVQTHANTVASLLKDAGVAVSPGDMVNPGPSANLPDDAPVVVRHAVPVTIELGADRIPLRVFGTTVGDALVAAGFDPCVGLKVSPDVDAPLVSGMTISATDVFVRVLQEEKPIPAGSRLVPDPAMPINTQRLVIKGAPGRLLRILESVVIGGKETGRVLKAERVVQAPVEQIIAVGTKRDYRIAVNGDGARTLQAANLRAPTGGKRLTVVATAYCPGGGIEGGYHAATGARLGYGIIAVDPDIIPLGTRMYVPGYGYGVAADTGGAITGRRIDLCFETHSAVDAWGVQTVTVILLP
jgi:uncharacterized protein YabE (DUF348 family)